MPSAAAAVAHWKSFNLPALQRELDETAGELAARQDASDASRKKLVEQSKDFKKTTPDDVRQQVTPLLKSFQSEIDSLSRRSKAAEAAFLSLYKKIVETPDPYPCLESSASWQKKAQRVGDLEIENKNLRETLEQYNAEFAEIKNQEVTIRQLKEKVKSYEETIETAVKEKVAEKDIELQRYYGEREAQLQEAGNILSSKVQDSERRAEALQASLKAVQQELYALRARADDSTDAKSTELEMLVSDSERANQRAEAAEREVQALRDELDSTRNKVSSQVKEEFTKSENDPDTSLASMELEISAKEKQVSQLLLELKTLEAKSSEERKASMEKESELSKQLSVQIATVRTLEGKLSSMKDYDEIKRELNVMKSIEFGAGGSEGGKSLESLLLEKNKGLQNETTSLKAIKQELEGETADSGSGVGMRENGWERAREDGPSPSPNPNGSNSTSRNSANQTPPGPLQQVVDAMGCFLGAELVSAYAQQLQDELGLNALKTLGEAGHNGAAPETPPAGAAAMPAPSGSAAAVCAQRRMRRPTPADEVGEEDLQNTLAKHDLFDVDKAIREGMPKFIAETMAIERLQIIVAENVTKLGEVSLDTSEVAAHCRRLLTMYNLGQRLFAKTILNQSQGSLSELLSKPRPWQRLTEKGREAFRKMYAWVSDERSIALLRSLSPRRPYMSSKPASDPLKPHEAAAGPDSPPVFRASKESKSTPEFHSSAGQTRPLSDEDVVGSGSNKSASEQSFNKISTNNRWRHDDIPKEMVFQIYQRELSKLKEQEATLHMELKGRSSRGGARHSIKSERGDTHSPDPPQALLPPSLPKELAACDSMDRQTLSRTSSCSENTPTHPTSTPSGSKNLKAVLPAVTQEQFEFYSNINTEELVKSVKEFLSNQSISQRLFGEHVLGLSQGSVSDLLARPKPWHMLTQKGREPFIRMQMFLDDETAVEQLRNRKGGGGMLTPESTSLRSNGAGRGSPFTGSIFPETKTRRSKPLTESIPHRPDTSATHAELDTQEVVDKVKRILHSNSIGQKVFGEAVLGVSQGTVSELLSKPKPWGSLSLRGREPYIRMHWWLQDPRNIEKLEQYVPASRGGGGFKRSMEELEMNGKLLDPLLTAPAQKKTRALITEEQKEALKFAFDHDPYPSSKTLEFLAQELDLSLRTVVNWFHNHRMRVKLQVAATPSPPGSCKNNDSSTSRFDPSSSSSTNSTSTSTGDGQQGGRASTEEGDPAASLQSAHSWKRGLMDVISMLSAGDPPTAPSSVASSLSPSPSSPTQHTSNQSSQGVRKILLDKLETNVRQPSAVDDWNDDDQDDSKKDSPADTNEGVGWEF